MADYSSTKEDCDYDEWYDQLEMLAECDGESVADKDAWIDPYERGLTPQEAYEEEFGDF